MGYHEIMEKIERYLEQMKIRMQQPKSKDIVKAILRGKFKTLQPT